jgi:diaminohydroxyphosphoribosylaminopyrimidine deaminase/5-amino-6-(5-phosphoribosylamino)uracil reductase
VILKWAQSADGYLGKTGERTPISTPATRRLVHRWRSECDAILVGANTALIDNPQLDSRYYPVRSPLRICFDQRQQLPDTHFLLDDTLATWILGPQRAGEWHHTRFMPLDGLDALMGQLYQHQKAALLVEGGPTLLSSFLKAGLADEIRIITHHARLHEGVKAPLAPLGWEEMEQYAIGADTIQLLAPSVKAP